MRNIAFLLFDQMLASSLTLPLEMLNAADNQHRALGNRTDRINIKLASRTLAPVSTQGGLRLSPTHTFDELEKVDVILIPGFWRSPFSQLKRNADIPVLIDALMAANPMSIVCAVGTGSVLLAESGRLDHKAATSHWYYLKELEERYPAIHWQKNHLITQSNRIFCTSSVNSIADLTIRFIELAYTSHIAKRVQSQFSPEIRRDYGDSLYDENSVLLHADELIADVQAFIKNHATDTINVEHLAKRFNLHTRTLQRRFKEACGLSLIQFQQKERIKGAEELLRKTDLNVQDIANFVGFSDASHFTSLFKKHTEQTPRAYRNAVKSKLFKG